MKRAMVGEMVKPSASLIAGSNSVAQGSLPHFLWASAASATLPGTPTLRPPVAACMNGIGLPSGPRNWPGLATPGAFSRPSMLPTGPFAG